MGSIILQERYEWAGMLGALRKRPLNYFNLGSAGHDGTHGVAKSVDGAIRMR